MPYKNPEDKKLHNKQYLRLYQNRPKFKKYTHEYHYNKYRSIKDKLFDLLGIQCSVCGFSDIRALQFDHINGGGDKTGRSYYKYISDPDIKLKLQVLCANCNWIKRHENKEHRKSLFL